MNKFDKDFSGSATALQVDAAIDAMQETSTIVMDTLSVLAINLHVHGQNAHLIRFIEKLPPRSKGGIASGDVIDWFINTAQCCYQIELKNGKAKVIPDNKRRMPDILESDTPEAKALFDVITNPEFVKVTRPSVFDASKKAKQYLKGNLESLIDTQPDDKPLQLVEITMVAHSFIASGAIDQKVWDDLYADYEQKYQPEDMGASTTAVLAAVGG